MYEVIEIINFARTRKVILKNLETGTVDTCFDNSVLWSKGNFEFMQVGQKYDCKIILVGDAVPAPTKSSVLCPLKEHKIPVGTWHLAKTEIGGDEYYISEGDLKGFKNSTKVNFYFSWKDLVRVDDAIHPDMLED